MTVNETYSITFSIYIILIVNYNIYIYLYIYILYTRVKRDNAVHVQDLEYIFPYLLGKKY